MELSTGPKTITGLTGRELLPLLQGGDGIAAMLAELVNLPRGAMHLLRVKYAADRAATADADPGASNVRWNDADQAAATEIYIADADSDASDHGALWASLDSGGYLYLWKQAAPATWQQWQITSVTDASGYLKLGVTLIGGEGTFADEDPVVLTLQQPNPTAPGEGDVVGAEGSVDGELPAFSGTTGKALKGSGVTVDGNKGISGYRAKYKDVTGTTYTAVDDDSGKVLRFTNASDVVVTLPNDLPRGWCVSWTQVGAGQVSFTAASGATRNNRSGHTKSAGQWAKGTLEIDSNSDDASAIYVLAGDCAA
ncbi:MAG TPA: hypothetical protein VM619_14895 [Luteimonas sp.]|nr:hypothetical protein [Luteimonas sp.]